MADPQVITVQLPQPVSVVTVLSDAQPQVVTVQSGIRGEPGEQGAQGAKGDRGEKGDKGDPGTAVGVTGTGWVHISDGVVDELASTPTAADVGADASGLASTVQSNLDTHIGLTTSAHGGVVPSTRKITASLDLSADRTLTYSDVGAEASGAAASVKAQLSSNMSTGLLAGGLLTINADPSKFDISAGVGMVVDNHSTPGTTTIYPVTWPTTTVSASMGSGGRHPVYVSVDKDFTVFQSTSPVPVEQYCSRILIGVISVNPGTNQVVAVYDIAGVSYEPTVRFRQFLEALGTFNVSGNVYYANGANLTLNRTSGSIFRKGYNYNNDRRVPDIAPSDAVSQESFFYVKHVSGAWTYGPAPSTAIDPEHYDDGTDLQTVPTGKWTIHVIFYNPGTRFIQYGQRYYDTQEAAIAGIADSILVHPILVPADFVVRGFVIVQQGCTALNNSSTAIIREAGRFGLGSTTGGGSGGGESNTASNLGAGVGIYYEKSGVDLRFKSLKSTSGKVTISDSTGDHTVDLGVSLSKSDVGLGNVPNVDATNPANITQDSTHRFVSDTERDHWNTAYDQAHGHSNKSLLDAFSGAVAIAAGAATATSGTVIFSNSNGMAFGLNAGTMTASYTVPTQTQFVLSNGNGVSFGTNGSTVTASVQTNYLTTAMASNAGSNFVAASATLAGTNITGTFGSNGVSLSVGAYLTTAMASNASTAFAGTGTTLATTAGTDPKITLNTAGINFAYPKAITTARASNDCVGLNSAITANGVSATINSSGLSLNFPAFLTTAMASNAGSGYVAASATVAGTNITGTIASNGMSLSVAAPGGGAGFAAQGSGTYSQQTGTIQFANSNGITFGLSTNQMTASHNGLTTAMASNASTAFAGTGATTTTTAGVNIVATHNTAGLSIGMPAVITTAMASNAGSSFVAASATIAGTNITGTVASNGMSLSVAAPGGGAGVTLSTWHPWFPASVSTLTQGGIGVSTASAMVVPFVLEENLTFNCINFLQSLSFVSSTISGQQAISSQFGLFSNNAGTLSLISSNSFSIGATVSSVSATINFPTTTATSGYGYNTVTASTTAQAHSLFGTAGNRIVQLQFGGNMSLAPGCYWLGLHQRQGTTNAGVGVSSGFVGNAMNSTSNVGPIGSSTAAFSNNTVYHQGAHGWFTSTGLAGHSGTNLPGTMGLTGFNNAINVRPLVTFMST